MNETRNWRTLPIFLIACLAALAIGGLFTPGEWYQSLNRAPWNPPNIVFPIVWPILYILIAVAGWMIFAGQNRTLKWLWCVQLVVNAAWSWLFFGEEWPLGAMVDILFLDALVLAIIVVARGKKMITVAWLMSPYLLWLLLATSLNLYILLTN